MKMKIVVLEAASHGQDVSWDCLKEYGDLILYQTTKDEQIAQRIGDADIIIPNKCLLREENLCRASHLKLICEAATGYNNIDLEYCRTHHITVTNVKAYSTEAVAQHTFAMLLSVLEKLDYYTTFVESGAYSNQDSFTNIGMPFHELCGMKMGIIGLGNIGRRVAEIAAAFGMKVMYYSASGHAQEVPYRMVELDELLLESDVVSCHAPLNNRTEGMMNRDAFRKMKQTAIFLNLGRGPIVVEEDLAQAIEQGEIQAAALDVFSEEPIKTHSPLLRIKNRDRIFMTPHIAWSTVEARNRLVEDVAKSIKCFLEGNPRSVVSE